MKSSITAGLKGQDKTEMVAEFKSCHRLRARLTEMLDKKIDHLHEEMLNESNYQRPNWQLEQVDKIAQIKAQKYLISLLAN